MKLLAQRTAPALGEMWRAEHRDSIDLRAVEELTRDEACLDGLADADVVGDEQPHRLLPQRHEQRHELVRARLDADARERAKRPCARAKAEAHGVAQHRAGAVIAEVFGRRATRS
ncbi:MAG: hypothetical protein U0326_34100 [Polyangiales bacterium]